MIVDVHSHFIPRDCFDMLDDEGRPFGPRIERDPAGREVIVVDGANLGPVVAQVSDPTSRIRDMDKTRVDIQAISINPSSIFNDMEVSRATILYRRYNDAIAEVVTAHPDRFIGLASLPLQDIPLAVAELDRSVKLGLRGIQMGSNLNGRNLDEKELWPLYQRIVELDVPILVHPYYVAAADRLSRYWLINLVGNPVDTAIAMASVIFGGVLEAFPTIRFVFAHGGGAGPYLHGRWSRGYEMVEESQSIPLPPESYLEKMFFDSLTHSDRAMALLVDLVGAEQVVVGSDYPFAMGNFNPVDSIERSTRLSPAAIKQILEKSAQRLFNL